MGRRPHECPNTECPCFRCSVCGRRWLHRNKLLKHQIYTMCGDVGEEQKARDLAPKHIEPKPDDNSSTPATSSSTPPAPRLWNFPPKKVYKNRNDGRPIVKAFTTNNPHVLVCSKCGKYIRRSRSGVHINSKHKARMQIVHEDQEQGKSKEDTMTETVPAEDEKPAEQRMQSPAAERRVKVVKAFRTNNPHVLMCSLCKKYLRVMKVHMTKIHNAEMEVVDEGASKTVETPADIKVEELVVKAEPADFEFTREGYVDVKLEDPVVKTKPKDFGISRYIKVEAASEETASVMVKDEPNDVIHVKTEPVDDDDVDPLSNNNDDLQDQQTMHGEHNDNFASGAIMVMQDARLEMAGLQRPLAPVPATPGLLVPRFRQLVSCPFLGCANKFANQPDFEQHTSTFHPGPVVPSVVAHQGSLPPLLPLPRARVSCPAPGCREDFPTREDLGHHLKELHPDITQVTISLLPSKRVSLSCPSLGCTLDFPNHEDLSAHINVVHTFKKTAHSCPVLGCGEFFTLKKNLVSHIQSHSKLNTQFPKLLSKSHR